jgi:transposase
MLRRRHTEPLLLTDDERRTLDEWARRPTTAQRLAQRSRVVLACAEGLTNRTVSKRLRVSENSVCKWRERFRVRRLEGLTDEPRPGTPRTITDAAVVDVITRTLEGPPPMATQWSTRSMAEVVGLSKATISRIWQTFGLQSHRRETFKLSADPQFVDKVRDIVGLYLNPPDHAVVLCLDEKSQVQALDRTRPLLPMRPGIPARQTHDYIRHGTTSLFAALNVATGTVIGRCHRRHRHQELLQFLNQVDATLPPAGEVHVIMDNYGTHKVPKVARWFVRPPGITCISPRPVPAGSIRWSGFSPGSPRNVFDAAPSTASVRSKPPSTATSFITIRSANPSSGPRPLTQSSKVKRFCQRTSETRH